uniref:Putative secreted protein n=1 Tax=Anopheles darlingi TaxID=43151 RepID=A0A2M4DQP3_ANODA
MPQGMLCFLLIILITSLLRKETAFHFNAIFYNKSNNGNRCICAVVLHCSLPRTKSKYNQSSGQLWITS